MTRKRRVVAAITSISVLLMLPIPYLASPEWTVLVTDEAGHPLQGMLVRLEYENYSTESNSHEVDLTTDSNGRTTFSANMGFAPLLSRLFYTARSAAALAHASFGPTAYVLVFGDGREGSINSDGGTVYFWNGKPKRLASTVIARPRDP